jgi:hypothetical protein
MQSGRWAVVAFDSGDADAVVGVPALLAGSLRDEVLADLLPGSGRGVVDPVADGDTKAITGGLDAEVTRLLRGKFFHPFSHGAVAVVAISAQRREYHCGVRRFWRVRNHGWIVSPSASLFPRRFHPCEIRGETDV